MEKNFSRPVCSYNGAERFHKLFRQQHKQYFKEQQSLLIGSDRREYRKHRVHYSFKEKEQLSSRS